LNLQFIVNFSAKLHYTGFCRTILLSIISLLNEPNTFSPANVDASVSFRKWRESKGKDKEYELIVRYVGSVIITVIGICAVVRDI